MVGMTHCLQSGYDIRASTAHEVRRERYLIGLRKVVNDHAIDAERHCDRRYIAMPFGTYRSVRKSCPKRDQHLDFGILVHSTGTPHICLGSDTHEGQGLKDMNTNGSRKLEHDRR